MKSTKQVPRIGIIGGSGLQKLLALSNVSKVAVDTPFGAPSDELLLGELDGVSIAFIQRHGPGHLIPPANINVRANIAALKYVGCTQVISMSAVGSLKEECPPGTFVLIDQFIDRTIQRQKTYFGMGLVGHVPFGDPICGRMHANLKSVATEMSLPHKESGTYLVMEGPQFSTRAESNLYRQWGGTVVGMTAMPEAKLAREAELCYAMVAMVTDYDCWFAGHETVTASLVSQRMSKIALDANVFVEKACSALKDYQSGCQFGCDAALDGAIMTHRDRWDEEIVKGLRYLAPRLGQAAE